MTTPIALGIAQARAHLSQLTVIDVRTPAECASGHLPGTRSLKASRALAEHASQP